MSLDLLRRGLKISHLRLLAELARQSRLTNAATAIGITQPAASRLISEIERITEAAVYVRSGRGIELTEVGRKLAERCVRILQELDDAGRDIDQHMSGQSGHVSIGSVTGPAIEYVLPALRHIRLSYPDISISVDVAPSRDLAPKLEDGRLDFSLSRVPVDEDPALFEERPLLREPASIIARIDHPLTRTDTPIPAQALLGFDWVLPPAGAPIRATAEQALRDKGLTLPSRVLTTSSFLFTLATVQRTNAIAPVAQSVARSFAEGADGTPGSLTELQSDLPLSVETYSFLTRKGQVLTPVAQVVAREVLRAVGEKGNPG
ncbi:LysR substrate-binding domain-containing protein [Roseibium marinum]|uniref:DNA-binding transcriptional LysR family regulator n=1 Tax=Roseibium marinum TaxID=281252 RepID=A0A2S3UXG7_9HYPH|nr:LysR substrate-binding domain-containing protein [Roseibium marinum]POF32213.1 DNA-binding transcriptional LysR family regulator [Roseibium marinum]